MTSSAPAGTAVPPAQHNPEALEDVKPAAAPAFQNVDLEANNAAAAAAAAPAPVVAKPVDKSALTEFARHTDWGVLNLLLAFSSIVVMISSATVCGGGVYVPGVPFSSLGVPCTGIPGYQVACATISAIIALISALLYHLGKLDNKRALEGISVFQFLWWTAGMIVLTFFGSFQSVDYANGYFGTWGAFLFAALALVSVSDLFESTVDRALFSVRSPLLFLAASSAIAMGASISPCSPVDMCTTYRAFAVALSTISLFFALVLLLVAGKLPATVLKVTGWFLVTWWVVGFAVVTFGGPFVTPGNGYFASMASVLASVMFLKMVMRA